MANTQALVQILGLIYFMLPAYIANMAPVLGKGILKQLAVPIDAGKKWKGKPILGKNKTWRGVILGTAAGALVFLAQKYFYACNATKALSIIDYSTATLWIGVMLGLGAIIGDAAESFFKRRSGIKPGKKWFPFDQIDFTIGALLFASVYYFPGWGNAAVIIVLSMLGHVLFSHLGYYLRLKKDKW